MQTWMEVDQEAHVGGGCLLGRLRKDPRLHRPFQAQGGPAPRSQALGNLRLQMPSPLWMGHRVCAQTAPTPDPTAVGARVARVLGGGSGVVEWGVYLV